MFGVIYAGANSFHIFFPAAYDITSTLLPEYAFSLPLNLCKSMHFKNISASVF